MNKIELGSKSIHLLDDVYLLEINDKIDLEINVSNVNSKLIIVGYHDYHLKINVNDNAKLIVNSLNFNNSVSILINLYQDSKVVFNHSVSSDIDSNNEFSINHYGNNSESIINNNAINLGKNKLFFKIDGVVKKDLHSITCNQSSKIINFDQGNSKIIPNLIIDSNDIIANHASYIGEINEDDLFYLASRGLKIDIIRKLIYKAVLLGKMELEDEKDLFNQIIND